MTSILRTTALATVIALGGLATPLFAHHSFAAVYDQTKPLRVEGSVVRVEWRSPHVIIEVAAAGESGAQTTWSFEMGAPRVLTQRLGWSVDTLKPGDHVVVEGFLARTGGPQAAAQYITTAAGQRLRSVLPFR